MNVKEGKTMRSSISMVESKQIIPNKKSTGSKILFRTLEVSTPPKKNQPKVMKIAASREEKYGKNP